MMMNDKSKVVGFVDNEVPDLTNSPASTKSPSSLKSIQTLLSYVNPVAKVTWKLALDN